MAALLHDIGHYPFSHALEEAGFPSHETLGVAKLSRGRAGRPRWRRSAGPASPGTLGALITGASASPLQGLISGSLDLDKIDYLSRDARMCGVPYGTVDVDRLLATLTLVETAPGRYEVGRAGEGRERARVAALRQVPDVPERLLAPRRAVGHLHVQAGGARRRGAGRS